MSHRRESIGVLPLQRRLVSVRLVKRTLLLICLFLAHDAFVQATWHGSLALPDAPALADTAPSVTTQPSNQTVRPGESASFVAAAVGTPVPTILWQASTDGGSTWADVAGATSMVYDFVAALADDGKRFRAVFTNSAGVAISNTATLSVLEEVRITQHPADQHADAGAVVTFTAAATGADRQVATQSQSRSVVDRRCRRDFLLLLVHYKCHRYREAVQGSFLKLVRVSHQQSGNAHTPGTARDTQRQLDQSGGGLRVRGIPGDDPR